MVERQATQAEGRLRPQGNNSDADSSPYRRAGRLLSQATKRHVLEHLDTANPRRQNPIKIDEKNYKEIAEFIHSDESPVGIDAKKNAHLHYPQAQSNRNTLRSSREETSIDLDRHLPSGTFVRWFEELRCLVP